MELKRYNTKKKMIVQVDGIENSLKQNKQKAKLLYPQKRLNFFFFKYVDILTQMVFTRLLILLLSRTQVTQSI